MAQQGQNKVPLNEGGNGDITSLNSIFKWIASFQLLSRGREHTVRKYTILSPTFFRKSNPEIAHKVTIFSVTKRFLFFLQMRSLRRTQNTNHRVTVVVRLDLRYRQTNYPSVVFLILYITMVHRIAQISQ